MLLPPPPPPPEVVDFVTLHEPASDPENTVPVDLSLTLQVTVWVALYEFGRVQFLVFHELYDAVASEVPQLIRYSKSESINPVPAALQL